MTINQKLEDLGTQVYYWDAYKKDIKQSGKKRGRYIRPEVAEFLAGGVGFLIVGIGLSVFQIQCRQAE